MIPHLSSQVIDSPRSPSGGTRVKELGHLPLEIGPVRLGKHSRISINDEPLTSATGGAKYHSAVQRPTGTSYIYQILYST